MKAVDRADMMQVCWLLWLKQSEPEAMRIMLAPKMLCQCSLKRMKTCRWPEFTNRILRLYRCTTFDGSTGCMEGIETRNAVVMVAAQ